MWTLFILCACLVASTVVASETSIFDFEANDITGKRIHLSTFKGKKAYLVVNVASK